jgi:ribosomal protein S18 acetylase RimI-like enzyme
MTIKIAKSEGFTTLWLGVWEHNDRAIEFYKRQGFVDVGQHDFWLGKDRQIDRIMQLTLTA